MERTLASVYDRSAPKRPANLSVNSDLLAKAREEDLNLSALLEAALAEALRTRRREAWVAENAAAIEAYNAEVEARGVFSDGLRGF
jgi:antitoxin CcdA